MSTKNANIFLIGPRASGKSKTARHLHRPLDYAVLSTDTLASYESNGLTIPQIVAGPGSWPRFRELEYTILQKVCRMSRTVIDCGGGIVVDLDEQGNEIKSKRKIDLIKKSGYVIYLTADPEVSWQKVSADKERPALSGKKDEYRDFQEMLTRRDRWYREIADFVMDSTSMKGKNIAARLLKHLQKKGFQTVT